MNKWTHLFTVLVFAAAATGANAAAPGKAFERDPFAPLFVVKNAKICPVPKCDGSPKEEDPCKLCSTGSTEDTPPPQTPCDPLSIGCRQEV